MVISHECKAVNLLYLMFIILLLFISYQNNSDKVQINISVLWLIRITGANFYLIMKVTKVTINNIIM